MTLIQHEIDYIADRILEHVSAKLVGVIRATIRKEMQIMTNQAISDLEGATSAIVDTLAQAVTVVHTEASALAAALAANAAATGVSLDPAIEAQVSKLSAATTVANNALAALQAAPAAAAPAAAAPAAPAAAAADPAAPAAAAPAAPVAPAA